MNKSIYLSHFLSKNTPTFGNEDMAKIEPKTEISNNEKVNMFSVSISNNHIGTHIDLPKHFFDCDRGIEYYCPNTWFFNNVELIEVFRNNSELITSSDLLKIVNPNAELLLIKTGYENYRNKDKYWNDNPGLTAEIADFLRDKYSKIRAVGFDFISLTSWKHKDEGLKAHLNFLDPEKGEIFIIEDMKLSGIGSNPISKVSMFPWLIEDIDSSPVTVIAEIESHS